MINEKETTMMVACGLVLVYNLLITDSRNVIRRRSGSNSGAVVELG